jgi:glycosyltransferase involved in cell wall biosynthesis
MPVVRRPHPRHLGMTSAFPLSLIVAVYNKPGNLRLVAAACARQSFREFEVLVADDGSGPGIAEVVAAMRSEFHLTVNHLWHEDRGWRKNAILNAAIRSARGEQIVFIDGDCLPSRHFLLDHWRERAPGRVLLGRRVEMSRRWTEALTEEAVRSGAFERMGWSEVLDGLRGHSLRVEDGLRMPNPFLRRVLLRRVKGMLGSNFSAARRDLEAVNGFDEEYTGPGCGEDSDLQYRLSLIGVTGKSLRNLAVQYHLWHPRQPVSDPSWDRFELVKQRREPRCLHGLVDLTHPDERSPQHEG